MSRTQAASFQRAFVALSYVAGSRNTELIGPLSAPHVEARLLTQRLSHPERERRAEVLAAELARITRSLEIRSIK